ncbi:MAG TPA: glutamine synthetase family protein [Streptosporangiaceae bacterium]|nr:glutamine synthetase family protein [Streptosporangiaceae bacterium]
MAEPSTSGQSTIASLREQGVDVVRVSYSDMLGVDRGRDVLIDELPAAVGHGLPFCRAIFHTSPQGDVVPVAGGLDAGLPDVLVKPDLSTLTPLPWEHGAAWAIGDVLTPDGQPHSESPRAVLRRVESLLAQHGLRVVIGPELEYFLLEADDSERGWRRYADAPGNVYVVGAKGDPRRHLIHTLRALRDAGLRVTAANHEFFGGQFEINLNHSGALDAADRAFRLKSAIQEIARLDGLMATFMAKPFNAEGGSGFHLHASLVDESGANIFGDPAGTYGLSEVAFGAIAGILAHAKALAALMNPTINSYKRFGPDTLAPWLVDWGLDNRSALIRIPPERGEGARMEIRLGDATANPYLAIAGALAAVYLGVRDGLTPQPALEGYGYDPSSAELLPQRLPDALDALESDTDLIAVLGEVFCSSFVTYKRNEVERFERHVTDWEFTEYAYHL